MKLFAKKTQLLFAVFIFLVFLLSLVISCSNDKKSNSPRTKIVYYYDGSAEKHGVLERMVKVQRWYNTAIDEALQDGTIKNKVELVIKKGAQSYSAKDDMLYKWGYKDPKSPDVWLGNEADLNTYESKSGSHIIHGFDENEYNEFWNAAGFQNPLESLDRKSHKVSMKNKVVRTTLPWFTKGFFNIEYIENRNSIYDNTKNGKYRSGEIKLGSSTMPMESTLIGMNNGWNHNPFTNAILEYLRGPIDEGGQPTSDLIKYKRNNANGFSNTIADVGFINKDGKNVGSILFAKKSSESKWNFTDIDKLDLETPSDHAVAWHQLIQSHLFDQKIHSINYDHLSNKFRRVYSQGIFATIDLATINGFMGVSKDNKENYRDTPKNKHKYTNLLGAGIDWVKFLKHTLEQGKLTHGDKPTKEHVEQMLSHYHIYRMPKIWQVDTPETQNFPLLGKDGKTKHVKKLDGQNIYGVNDGKATEVAITPMEDGDFLTFNQRTWEIKDKQLQEDKIKALKIFVGALYNTKNDEEYGKLLLQKQGVFSSNQRLRQLGMPKKNPNGKWNSQIDRLWSETEKALRSIEVNEHQKARVGSDWWGWNSAYWDAWKLYDNTAFTPYENAKFFGSRYKQVIKRESSTDKKRYASKNKHFLGEKII